MSINGKSAVVAILPPTESTDSRRSRFVTPSVFNAMEAVVLCGSTASGTLTLLDAVDDDGSGSAALFTAAYGGTQQVVRVTISPIVGFANPNRSYFSIQLDGGIPLTAAVIQGFGGRTLVDDIVSDVGIEVVPYHASAVHFDGSTSIGTASLTCVDSEYVFSSHWFKTSSNQGGHVVWAADTDGTFESVFYRFGDNDIKFNLGQDGVGALFALTVGVPSNDAWHHMLCAAQTNLSAGNKKVKIYLDDVDVTSAIQDIDPSFIPAFNGKNFVFGDDGILESTLVSDIADARVHIGHNILVDGDIPEATRRLFIDAQGKPVDPATATFSLGEPMVLFTGDASTFATNQGTGGAFTTTGALTDASTSPSD